MPRRIVKRKPKVNRNEIRFMRGHKFKVPNHPPEFCSVPWFPLILRINNPLLAITLGNVYSAFVAQLSGLSFSGSTLNIRLQSIRIWGPIPTTNTPLNVQFREIFDDILGSSPAGSVGILEDVTDYADQVNRARVGYSYSTAQQQKALFVVTGQADPLCTLSGAGAGSVAYISLLWRPFIAGNNPSLVSNASDFEVV